jgi:hypothetical protein
MANGVEVHYGNTKIMHSVKTCQSSELILTISLVLYESPKAVFFLFGL